MYKQIKQLADEAVALQNKDRMDAALREISVVCGQLADAEALTSSSSDTAFPFDRAKPDAVDTALTAASALNSSMVEDLASKTGGQVVTYGEAKTFDTEGEMIAATQGAPSPMFPLPASVPVPKESSIAKAPAKAKKGGAK